MKPIDEILISRYGNIVESRQKAEDLLLCREFKKGEPAIINYYDERGEVGTITAIGTSNNVGKEAFNIISSGSLIYVRVVEEGFIDVSTTVHGEVYLWKDEKGKWCIVEIDGTQKKVAEITEIPRTYLDIISGNIYVSTKEKNVYCLNDLDSRFVTKTELEEILKDYVPSGTGNAEINTFAVWPDNPDDIPYGENCYQIAPKVTFGDLEDFKKRLEEGNIGLREVVQFISSIDFIPSDNWLLNLTTNLPVDDLISGLTSGDEEAANELLEKLGNLEGLQISLPLVNRNVLKNLYFNSQSFKNIITEILKITRSENYAEYWFEKDYTPKTYVKDSYLGVVYFPEGIETDQGVKNYLHCSIRAANSYDGLEISPFLTYSPISWDEIGDKLNNWDNNGNWETEEERVNGEIKIYKSFLATKDSKILSLVGYDGRPTTYVETEETGIGEFKNIRYVGTRLATFPLDWLTEGDFDQDDIDEVEAKFQILGTPIKSKNIVDDINAGYYGHLDSDEYANYDDDPQASIEADEIYVVPNPNGYYNSIYSDYNILATDKKGDIVTIHFEGEDWYIRGDEEYVYSSNGDYYREHLLHFISTYNTNDIHSRGYSYYCDCYGLWVSQELELKVEGQVSISESTNFLQDLLVKIIPALFKVITGFHADITKTKFGSDIYKEEIKKIVNIAFSAATPILSQVLPPELDLEVLVNKIIDSIVGYTLKVELYNCLDITTLLRRVAALSIGDLINGGDASLTKLIEALNELVGGNIMDFEVPVPLKDIRGEGNIVKFDLPVQDVMDWIIKDVIGEDDAENYQDLFDLIIQILRTIKFSLLSFTTTSVTDEVKKQNIIEEQCDDIAYSESQGILRTPTVDELKELVNSPFIKLIPTDSGVFAYSTKTGNSILLPYTGEPAYDGPAVTSGYDYNYVYLWSSTAASHGKAYYLEIAASPGSYDYNSFSVPTSLLVEIPEDENDNIQPDITEEIEPYQVYIDNYMDKCKGLCIRPVCSGSDSFIAKSSSNPDFKFVDLGLSVLWCDRNVRAYDEEDCGWYYSWGKDDIYTEEECQDIYKKYNTGETLSTGGKKGVTTYWDEEGNITQLIDEDGRVIKTEGQGKIKINVGDFDYAEKTDDVAHYILGGTWRIPNVTDWEELYNSCTVTVNDDYIIYEGPNGNSISIYQGNYKNGSYSYNNPSYTDNYATSEISGNNNRTVFNIRNNSSSTYYRYQGFSIRPISDNEGVDLGLPSGTKWAATNLTASGLASTPEDRGGAYMFAGLEDISNWIGYISESNAPYYNPNYIDYSKKYTKYNSYDNKYILENWIEKEVYETIEKGDLSFNVYDGTISLITEDGKKIDFNDGGLSEDEAYEFTLNFLLNPEM